MTLTYLAKFWSISSNRSQLFLTILFEILRPPLFGLVPEVDLNASLGLKEVTSKAQHEKCIWLIAIQSSVLNSQSFFATFITSTLPNINDGSPSIVQDCSNHSNHAAGISLHRSPVNKSEREKWVRFVRTRCANFNPKGVLLFAPIAFWKTASRELCMWKD